MFCAATELSRGESNGNPWAKCRVRDPSYVCIPHNNPWSMPPQHPNPTLFPAALGIHKLGMPQSLRGHYYCTVSVCPWFLLALVDYPCRRKGKLARGDKGGGGTGP
jgi:hypothetical protein